MRFARIALGSLYETDSLLAVADALDQIEPAPAHIRDQIISLAKRIERFIAHYENRMERRVREDIGDLDVAEQFAAAGGYHAPRSTDQDRIATGDPI